MCRVDNIREKYNGQTKLYDFYRDFLGVDDSLVRERMFDALATLMGCSYEHIYYQWLDHSKEPFGLQMVTDMTGLRFKNENKEE